MIFTSGFVTMSLLPTTCDTLDCSLNNNSIVIELGWHCWYSYARLPLFWEVNACLCISA